MGDRLASEIKRCQMLFKCDAAPLAIKYTLATHFINKHWNRLNPPNTLELILLATCYGQHVSEISSKATKTLGFLRHNLALAHQHTKEVAYQTLVRPQLEYAAPIWHPYNETETKKGGESAVDSSQVGLQAMA